MSEHSNDRFQDPKPFNTISILNQRNHIKLLIDTGQHPQALNEMCTLVNELDINKKDSDIIQIQKELNDNYEYSTIASNKDMHYFRIINRYLNDTYCRGFKAPMDENFFPNLESDENDGPPNSE
jgi:hypothetical protein